MARKTKVTGFNIYKDKKNRDIYYDTFSKEGYVITPNDVSQLNFYQKRFILPVIIFALTYTIDLFGFKFGVMGAGAAAILSFVCVEYFFRFRFLKSMITIPNFVPNKQEDYFHQVATSAPFATLILKGLLYIALGVALVIFGYLENFELFEWAVCIVITTVVVVVGFFQLYAAYIKHNMK